MNLKGVLEGLLFVVGDEGLTIDRIKEILEISETEAKSLLTELRKDYEDSSRGIRISFLGNAFKLTTKTEHKEIYNKLVTTSSHILSNAALEVLAVVAYNEPITRSRIEEIRGVNSDGTIYKLLEYNLIEEAGKLDAPGKPTIYQTTQEFLKMFGIPHLDELPELPRYKIDENEQIVLDEYIESSTNNGEE